jgi:23S rRNA (guanosine2251-2'-O)-methyltransferase
MLIYGINPVLEALSSGYPVLKVYISRGFRDKKGLLSAVKREGVKVVEVDRLRLRKMTGTNKHQGVVALISPVEPVDYSELVESTVSSKGYLLFLDRITDPGNLGAIFRSASAFGAEGIVLPRDRSVAVTDVVVKASTGAVFHVPFSVVSSFTTALAHFKRAGGWLVGIEVGGEDISNFSFPFPVGVVAGSEGRGISRSARKFLDAVVSIPMCGRVGSLNVSSAVAVGLYLVFQQRKLQ